MPAVKLGCFVVHLGGLKTLPFLYCYLRSLIGQFVINGPQLSVASAALLSGTGILDQRFVCLTPKSTQIYQIDTICHQTLCHFFCRKSFSSSDSCEECFTKEVQVVGKGVMFPPF